MSTMTETAGHIAPVVTITDGITVVREPTRQERYVAACKALRLKWGLTDWRFNFTESPPSKGCYAEVGFDWDARIVQFTAFTTDEDITTTPEDGAKHEVLHVLLYDFTRVLSQRADTNHPDCLREEHRIIERLQPLLEGP